MTETQTLTLKYPGMQACQVCEDGPGRHEGDIELRDETGPGRAMVRFVHWLNALLERRSA